MSATAEIRDASTIVLLRSHEDSLQTFLMCRHRKSGFMGGAHVFPGGKVDTDDLGAAWAPRLGVLGEEAARRLSEQDPAQSLGLIVAAVRETFEEAGVLIGRTGRETSLADARQQLLGGAPFSRIAQEMDLQIAADALTPYARWVTPEVERYRFDTRFFIAVVPEGQHAQHDGTETTSALWVSPAGALERMNARQMILAPPTLRTLEWLAGFDEPAAVIEAAASRPPPLVRPKVVSQDQGWFLALPGDPAHPEPERALPGSTRLVFDAGIWRDAEGDVG